MAKLRFLNQKLGKRMSRKLDLLKSSLTTRQRDILPGPADWRTPKKGESRQASSLRRSK
jgi:hypothetical protein